jgi:5'-deoxynucleotidase YfbR-like HD superfamily hydrolase
MEGIVKTITLYDWTDVQAEICKEMGIEKKYFRNYHELTGGEYKDLWHEWLEFFDQEVRNDTTNEVYLSDAIESMLEWISEENKPWLKPFIEAVYRIWKKYEDEKECINIRYCW